MLEPSQKKLFGIPWRVVVLFKSGVGVEWRSERGLFCSILTLGKDRGNWNREL